MYSGSYRWGYLVGYKHVIDVVVAGRRVFSGWIMGAGGGETAWGNVPHVGVGGCVRVSGYMGIQIHMSLAADASVCVCVFVHMSEFMGIQVHMSLAADV